ncbi:unnamed protein product [Meloidogyne enterolobii]|uniref:Uncharacterized protein n=1 Tax=Meloidogyne enterolobii TaxID=390850 RepID=A0ACB0ZT17_MELEN
MPPSYFIIEKMDKVVENLDKVSKIEEKSLKIRGETSNENENKMEVIDEEEDENETKGEEEDKLKKKKEKIEKEKEHLIKLSEVVRSKYILPKMAEINVLTSLIYQFLFSNNPNEGLSSSKLGNIFKEINEASEKNMEFEVIFYLNFK